ncbi:MAG: methyltransferase domain-containing protein [Alphaproteobacteria bacterium]|nr:methyltransferase domain-containing protein [Alphaproteobacteria bacterium]
MDKEAELAIIRRAYAKQIMAAAGVVDRRVEAAFAAVRREHFLGPGPWPILRWGRGYVPTPSRNPVYLYADLLVGILPERNLNNGQPSLHAALIAEALPRPGDHVVHVGAGVGYYTAILHHLTGRSGRVTAIEYDPELAARSTENFAGARNVRVVQGDGSQIAVEPADVIYVNAGATRPAERWLDALKDGGRLILPLTTDRGFQFSETVPIERRGAIFRIERQGDGFLARWISPVAIFPCEGVRDSISEAALAEGLSNDGWRRVTRLYRRDDVPEDRCWVRGPGWALAYE